MFVTKKRYEAETKQLEHLNKTLESELREADTEVDLLREKLYKAKVERDALAHTMQEVLDSKTASSNGTTLRIMRQLQAALDRLEGVERATFITDEPQPEGTLADLRRHFMGQTAGTVQAVSNKPVGANLDYSYAYVPAFTPGYDAIAATSVVGSVSDVGFNNGGGDFGGGGSTGSWSSDSCSSSSYDTGSSCDCGFD